MLERRYRVLVISSHPVQYHVPILRRMAVRPDLELHVAFCTLRGAEEAHDPEFGATVKWDIPLLDGYSWTHVPNRGSGDETFFGLWNPGILKMIREGHFDAVICYTGYLRATFWIAYLAAKISGTAFLFGTDAATLAPRDGRRWKARVKKWAWPLLFRLADQILVPSAASVDMMRSMGLRDERISLTPFAVDNDWWTTQAATIDRAAVRSSWGASPDDAVILFCAKFQSWKRPLDLLRAFAKASIPNTLLVFAGEGPLRPSLEAEATALGVAGHVRILGFLNHSQLPSAYTAADLLVLPSSYDACPVVVCEAMLCGCPVALSDQIRGRFDLVRPGVTGEIFPCGDTDRLAEVLRKLLHDRTGLRAMSENARARMTTWSPRENIEGTLDAVRRAVARVEGKSAKGNAPSKLQTKVPEPSHNVKTKIAR